MPAAEVLGPERAEVWKLDHTQHSAASKSVSNQERMRQPVPDQERNHRRVTIEHNNNVGIYGAGNRDAGVGHDDAEDSAAMQAQNFSTKTIKAARWV